MTKLLQLLSENRARALKNGVQSRIVQAANSDEATLYLYDVVVSDRLTAEYWGGVCAQDLVPQIAAIEANTINLRINSPGSDVFAAQAISAALKQHSAKVVGHIDGLAASAATDIACACDNVLIADGAMYMIHNAWTFAMGNRNDLLATAALLEKVDGNLAAKYVAKTGKTVDEVIAWMDAETWFTAAEAIDNGFADSLAENKKSANALWNLSAYGNAPKAFWAPPEDPALYANADHRARQQQRVQIAQRTRSL